MIMIMIMILKFPFLRFHQDGLLDLENCYVIGWHRNLEVKLWKFRGPYGFQPLKRQFLTNF
jgi:hypothetical protein